MGLMVEVFKWGKCEWDMRVAGERKEKSGGCERKKKKKRKKKSKKKKIKN